MSTPIFDLSPTRGLTREVPKSLAFQLPCAPTYMSFAAVQIWNLVKVVPSFLGLSEVSKHDLQRR